MCIHKTTYHHSDCCLPPGSALISHSDTRSGEGINYGTTVDVEDTPSLALASVPVFSAIDQSFESMVDMVDTQPPPHVIDYWFDRLGLSLDPTSSGNLSDSVGFLYSFPPLDGNDYVSSFLGTLCCMTPFRPTYDLE